MSGRVDRSKEEIFSTYGSKMVITRYGGTSDIDVYFPEYD